MKTDPNNPHYHPRAASHHRHRTRQYALTAIILIPFTLSTLLDDFAPGVLMALLVLWAINKANTHHQDAQYHHSQIPPTRPVESGQQEESQ